ncbi:MAG: chromosome segregation protein SMC [Erysipelotrichia bacterium]|nr:chromosome segregation protein SMC [Erysipelotrichia bacterium]
MKILQLRFKNINSLMGEWTIDFTQSAYVSDGIFAITGPTGSGKSSILDAICLALYGRTPRLKVISQSTNEVMSRQTAECFAEVVFASQTGTYRCFWEQHRARGSVSGKLSLQKHEIAEALSGRILGSKVSEVPKLVEEKTGMDFERFTRSMLLAQGGFAAFLEAPPDQRAPVLEQITGAEIYSQISIHVHECYAREKEKVELLKAEFSGIQLLGEEEIARLTAESDEKTRAEEGMTSHNALLTNAIQWRKTVAGLDQEQKKLDAACVQVGNESQNFATKRQRLSRAQQAAEFDAGHARIFSLRSLQQNELQALSKSEQAREKLEQALANAELHLNKSEETLAAARSAQKAELDVIKKVRTLDLQLHEHDTALKKASGEVLALEGRFANEAARKTALSGELAQSNSELMKVENYLRSNAIDGNLIVEFVALKEQLQNLAVWATRRNALSEEVMLAKKRQHAVNKEFIAHEKECALLLALLTEARNKVKQADASIVELLAGRLLREYRADLKNLTREMFFLQKINSLEEERGLLEDGRPCPLCGALEHPYALGNAPEIAHTGQDILRLETLIKTVEDLEEFKKEAAEAEKIAHESVIAADKKLEELKFKNTDAQAQLVRVEDEFRQVGCQLSELEAASQAKVGLYGIGDLISCGVEPVLSVLNKRLDAWKKHEQLKIELDKRLISLSETVNGCVALLAGIEADLNLKRTALTDMKSLYKALVDERLALYGSKDPDGEERRLEENIVRVDRLVISARERRDLCRQEFQENTTRIASLKENTGQRSAEIAQLEQVFVHDLIQAKFVSEADYLACRLNREEREALETVAKDLDKRQFELTAMLADVKERLESELSRQLTEKTLETLAGEQESLMVELRKCTGEIGAIRQKLADNNSARARVSEKAALIEAQTKERDRWAALHDLIGSSDGKKYRNFAQGLTFAILVAHANRQLVKMTDRYLLSCDSENSLELRIIDNYQAGEVRSTKNLSGGESFIVSLALALGLSNMSSRTVRVDSLFLDEGFGTLDEDALESALETLASLHQEGKLIGIISHVSALKERISSQIIVKPQSSGRSTLAGPGCKQINSRC